MPANIRYDGFSFYPHAQNITDAALECSGALSADDALLLAALAEVDAVIASQLLVRFGPRLIARLRWGPWKDLDALAADLRRSAGRTRHEIAGVYEATDPELLPAPWSCARFPSTPPTRPRFAPRAS